MPQDSHRDKVVDEVTDKVVQRQGVDEDESQVRNRAEDAVDELIDAPVQTFTPLLAENAVLSDIHAAEPDHAAEHAADSSADDTAERGPDEPARAAVDS